MDIADEELQTIMGEDQSHEQMPFHTESWNTPLPSLYDDVQRRVKLAAEWMKKKKAIDIDHESIVERYLQLTNILLGLQLWGDDIMVQGESALRTIEEDSTGFQILAPRLRTCFQEMLVILVDGELFTETNDDFSEFDELEKLSQHLRNFAGPLRTYQESAKNVGDVGAIRAAAAACLQKQRNTIVRLSTKLAEENPPSSATAQTAAPPILSHRLSTTLESFILENMTNERELRLDGSVANLEPLFTSIIQKFGAPQNLSENDGEKYTRQLRLELLRLRLCRWYDLVITKIGESHENIHKQWNTFERELKVIDRQLSPLNLSVSASTANPAGGIIEILRRLSRARWSNHSADIAASPLAIDARGLSDLEDCISGASKRLESCFQKELDEMRQDDASRILEHDSITVRVLGLLQQLGQFTDSSFTKLLKPLGGHSYSGMGITGTLHGGDYQQEGDPHGARRHASHDMTLKNRSRITIGDVYGGRSVFEDSSARTHQGLQAPVSNPSKPFDPPHLRTPKARDKQCEREKITSEEDGDAEDKKDRR